MPMRRGRSLMGGLLVLSLCALMGCQSASKPAEVAPTAPQSAEPAHDSANYPAQKETITTLCMAGCTRQAETKGISLDAPETRDACRLHCDCFYEMLTEHVPYEAFQAMGESPDDPTRRQVNGYAMTCAATHEATWVDEL